MKLFITGFLFIFYVSAQAEELTDLIYTNSNRSEFVFIKSENDQYIIEKIAVNIKSGFQDSVFKKSFSDKNKATVFCRSTLPGSELYCPIGLSLNSHKLI